MQSTADFELYNGLRVEFSTRRGPKGVNAVLESALDGDDAGQASGDNRYLGRDVPFDVFIGFF